MEEFCLIHGYEFMYYEHAHPIAQCAECEREREKPLPGLKNCDKGGSE
jgi:hypothetical protein